MGKGKKPSEVIEDFLEFLKKCDDEYSEAFQTVNEQDRRLQDFVHELEFASDKAERNKIATCFQQSRKERRQAKDKVAEMEKVHKFYKDPHNAPALKALKSMVALQKQTEDWLESERHYNKRVVDDSDDTS